MPVTIAIPFYNAEKYLLGAIKSVLYQSYQDWELLLIDDGSTDQSLEIAKSITDPRVRVISDGQNLKLASRLNQIAELSRYEYIARMDADDLMSCDRIKKQVTFLKEHPDIDIVCSGLVSIDNQNNIIGERIDSGISITSSSLLNKNIIVHPSIMARKAWFQRNKYNPKFKLAQDKDLWLRAISKGDFKIYYYPEPLYYYRDNENITLQKTIKYYKYEKTFIYNYAAHNIFNMQIKLFIKYMIKIVLIALGLKKTIIAQRRCKISVQHKEQIEQDLNLILSK